MQRSVATRAQLDAAGVSRSQIARLLDTGALLRIRRGRYCLGSLDSRLLTAARLGGKLTGASLFRFLGAWTHHAREIIHISVPQHHNLPDRVPTNVQLHWSGTRGGSLLEDLDVAIAHLAAHSTTEECVATLDSVIHGGMLGAEEAETALLKARRGRRIAPLLDPSAESGVESIVRLWLRRKQIRHRTQQWIGDYRVDFLVGKHLIVEIVGEEFHGTVDGFERDGTREAFLQGLGYRLLRLTARQVLSRMNEAEDAVLSIVRAKRHIRGRPPVQTSGTRSGWRRTAQSTPATSTRLGWSATSWRAAFRKTVRARRRQEQ